MTGVDPAHHHGRPISGIQKAATLLIMLGDKGSAELMRHLAEDEVERVGRVVSSMNNISSEQAESVLEEYVRMTQLRQYVLRGGVEYAKKMLTGAFGPETAQKLIDRFSKTLVDVEGSLHHIERADPEELASLLQGEHPQAVALVLSRLQTKRAAAVLKALSPAMRSDAALRLANLDQIPPDVVNKIADVIGKRLRTGGETNTNKTSGSRLLAELLNTLDSSTSDEILRGIEETSPNVAESVRHLMFVFEDLLKLDQNAIKELLSRVDRKVLSVALKGTSEQLKGKITASMSQRGAEMLREDLDATGPVRIREVEAAQQEMIALVRQLEQEGVIGAAGEEFVS